MDSSSISQFSQKILFACKRTIWAQFAPKLFNLIYHLSQIFWKHFSMIGHNRLTKVVLVSFLQRSSFSTIEQFISNLGQNYGTLCPMQLRLMIHSLKILKCSRMGYSSYTKVMLLCQKKFFGGQGQFGPNLGQSYTFLYLMTHSLRIFLKFCGMMRHNTQTKVVLVIFSKKLLWNNTCPMWPKITQPYITWTALQIFRNIPGWCGAIVGQ